MNGSVLVLVRVRDVNDNAPQFEQEQYRANVSENLSSGVDIVRVVAYDKDVDSIVRYSIEVNRVNSEGELIFDIDELSGVVSTAVCCLDRESIDQFTIKICATDEAISGDSSFHWFNSAKSAKSTPTNENLTAACTSVIIDVTDENDEPPMFVRDRYFLNLPDGVNELFPGRVLLNTTITDGDLPETNRFVCRITGTLRVRPTSRTTISGSSNITWDLVLKTVENQTTSETANTTTVPLSNLLLKYFHCDVSSGGNTRLVIGEQFDRAHFYHSFQTEIDSYKSTILAMYRAYYNPNIPNSMFIPDLPEYADVQLKLTVSDIGILEQSDDTSILLDGHLTSVELHLKLSTVQVNHSDDATDTKQPSQAIVTKQILPNGYNSNNGVIHSQFRLLQLTTDRIVLALLAIIVSVLFATLLIYTILKQYKRNRLLYHNGGGHAANITAAICYCCYARRRSHCSNIDLIRSKNGVGGVGAGGIDFDLVSGDASNGITGTGFNTSNTITTVEHLFPTSCYTGNSSNNSSCDAMMMIETNGGASGLLHCDQLQQQDKYHQLYPSGTGLNTSDLSGTPTAISDSVIAINNQKYSPFDNGTHLVLFDETINGHNESSQADSAHYSNASSLCTATTATYGYELNGPYDIAVYDLASGHLQLPDGGGGGSPMVTMAAKQHDPHLHQHHSHHQQHHHQQQQQHSMLHNHHQPQHQQQQSDTGSSNNLYGNPISNDHDIPTSLAIVGLASNQPTNMGVMYTTTPSPHNININQRQCRT